MKNKNNKNNNKKNVVIFLVSSARQKKKSYHRMNKHLLCLVVDKEKNIAVYVMALTLVHIDCFDSLVRLYCLDCQVWILMLLDHSLVYPKDLVVLNLVQIYDNQNEIVMKPMK